MISKNYILEESSALLGQYNTNLPNLVNESTKRLFELRKFQPNNELRTVKKKDIILGKFYLIVYNFNGNKIFCPIFPIDFRVIENKNILYSINIDYMPYKFKLNFFDLLISKQIEVLDINKDKEISEEVNLKGIEFEHIYKALNSVGKNYCITAFDINKIIETNVISFNFLIRFLHTDCSIVNTALMKELISDKEMKKYKESIGNIIKMLEDKLKHYIDIEDDYFSKLRAMEQNLKLFQNL